MADSFLEKVRKIGFNKAVSRDSRLFVIQTEVLGRERLMIRTTVLERGVVRLSKSMDCEDYSEELERVQKAAETQHDAYVKRVERGEMD
jgi:hypothetical protein